MQMEPALPNEVIPFDPLSPNLPAEIIFENLGKKLIDTVAMPGETLPIPPINPIPVRCRHPQVRVVARDEDSEFVECQHCGEVFDAIEYRDMIAEEEESKKKDDEAE